MEAASLPNGAPAGLPFAAELAVARGGDGGGGGGPAAPAGPVEVLPEPAGARPAGTPEREWRRAVRSRVVDEAIAVSLPAALSVLVVAWVAVYLAALAGIPGMGWAAYVGGLAALGACPWLVWRVASGRPAVRIPRRSTGEPPYAQLVANDAPRRWRRHADAHPRDHGATMFATRAVRPAGGGVRIEVLAYEPIGAWEAAAPEGDGWAPDVSRCEDRFWRMRVVDRLDVGDEDADALADGLERLEESARRREAAAVDAAVHRRADAHSAHERERERAAAERGLVAGVNGWTRRR